MHNLIDNLGLKILKEENPFLREIWAAGYDNIVFDQISQDLILISHREKKVKKISDYEYRSTVIECILKKGQLPDGRIHSWISEADGSADRFRKLINLETSQSEKPPGPQQ